MYERDAHHSLLPGDCQADWPRSPHLTIRAIQITLLIGTTCQFQVMASLTSVTDGEWEVVVAGHSGSNAGAEAALAAEASAIRLQHVPSDVVDTAVDLVIDTLAASIGAASEEVVGLAARIADDSGNSTRLTDLTQTSARSAAFVNGVAAHVLDFDDWLPVAGVHPSAPLLPAVMALAQDRDAPGPAAVDTRALLTSYIAGFEAQARIGEALGSAHYAMGFHPTATVGIFGAATGAAHLIELDPSGLQLAWGLAATQSAGLRTVFGTMGKSLHVGRAAEAGLISAQLAAAGATAPDDAIFGPNGFAATHGVESDAGPLTVPFSERWYLREVLVKKYAACFGTHAAIDALLSLRGRLDIDRVTEIELTVPELVRTVCAIPDPTTPLEGKFSLAFTAALALVRGTCRVDDFTVASLGDPTLKSIVERVRLRFDPSMRPQETHVRVRMDGGETLQCSADSSIPATPGARGLVVREKFASLVTPVLGSERCTALLAALDALPAEGKLSDITALLGEL